MKESPQLNLVASVDVEAATNTKYVQILKISQLRYGTLGSTTLLILLSMLK